MMKKLLPLIALASLFACNNSKKEPGTTDTPVNTENTTTTPPANEPTAPPSGTAAVTYAINDTARNVSGSILVQQDKEKLSPGNDLFGMITANTSNPDESFVLNFLFTPKPGTYPVVGHAYTRTNEVYGGLMGGKPKLTKYNVVLTECKDLGSNNMGGHKWSISGTVEGVMTIPAMGIMKMDKTHPAEVNVSKISFSNLTFDDNWQQMLEEGMKKLKGE